ncbi:hypothetical protein IEQ34_000881 [Dendrobium chrysotoxum]|uniref:Uncharacterized protein n=1 Tax=Dendrobium chrysotoxum TaxID=161865 RepID=A0AAV7HUT6_DENCH|nr:hypothetical protein IEQ34_000881 [Dendrobium chrysotoxum]
MIFIGLKRYCYAYMKPWWVSISVEVVGNNLYEPRDNLSLALETDGALVAMNLLEVAEECGVDVRLELSLGLSSGKVECKK